MPLPVLCLANISLPQQSACPLYAPILCAQLERADDIVARRKKIFQTYREQLEGTSGIGFQPVADWAEAAPWLFCITVDQVEYGHSRDELMEYLGENGVDTRPFFIPLHTLPPYREASAKRKEILPVTDKLASTGINLPTYSSLDEDDIERVCDLIKHFKK